MAKAYDISFRRGFTLVELLVTVTIITLLIVILLPSVIKAIEISRQARCVNRLHNIYTGVSQYAVQNKDFVPVLTNGFGVDAKIASYTGQRGDIAMEPESVRFTNNYMNTHANWDQSSGAVTMNMDDHVYRCPSSEPLFNNPVEQASYEFTGFSQWSGAEYPAGSGFEELPGRVFLSDTVTSPAVVATAPQYNGILTGKVVMAMDRSYAEGAPYYSNHNGGANVLTGDGVISWVPDCPPLENPPGYPSDAPPPVEADGTILEWLRLKTNTGTGLTRIMLPDGADALDESLSDVLRPSNGYGWHGRFSSETSFFAPLGGPVGQQADRWIRNEGTTPGSRKLETVSGIFY